MNNRLQTGAGANSEGISTKLKKNLTELIDSSKSLQKAIIHRRPNVIWEILSDQERMIRELEQYGYLWSQLFSGEVQNNPTVESFKQIVRNDVQELQKITSCTNRLSTSYLSAIRKALQHTGTNLANKKAKTNVYGKKGRMNIKKSFIISKEG